MTKKPKKPTAIDALAEKITVTTGKWQEYIALLDPDTAARYGAYTNQLTSAARAVDYLRNDPNLVAGGENGRNYVEKIVGEYNRVWHHLDQRIDYLIKLGGFTDKQP